MSLNCGGSTYMWIFFEPTTIKNIVFAGYKTQVPMADVLEATVGLEYAWILEYAVAGGAWFWNKSPTYVEGKWYLRNIFIQQYCWINRKALQI